MTIRHFTCALALLLLPALITVPGVVQPAAQMPVNAQDVMDRADRATLQAFVERAKAEVEEHAASADGVYDFAKSEFLPQGEWHEGSIYLFIFQDDGVTLFHAANPSLEGDNLWDNEDLNGVKYVQALISAAQMGGGYVEYHFDNPDVMGDEDEGSPKVSYTLLLDYDDQELVIGSGFYPPREVPVAPPLAYLILAALLAGGGYLRRRQR